MLTLFTCSHSFFFFPSPPSTNHLYPFLVTGLMSFQMPCVMSLLPFCCYTVFGSCRTVPSLALAVVRMSQAVASFVPLLRGEKKKPAEAYTPDPVLLFLILHPSINDTHQSTWSSIVLTLSLVTCPWRRLIEVHNLVSAFSAFWAESKVASPADLTVTSPKGLFTSIH